MPRRPSRPVITFLALAVGVAGVAGFIFRQINSATCATYLNFIENPAYWENGAPTPAARFTHLRLLPLLKQIGADESRATAVTATCQTNPQLLANTLFNNPAQLAAPTVPNQPTARLAQFLAKTSEPTTQK